MHNDIIKAVYRQKLIAIVRGVNPEYILPVGKALYEGGIRLVEVTFDQKAADGFVQTTEAISKLCSEFEDELLIGAGTVLSRQQVDLAKSAGAKYIITPSTDRDVIRYARHQGMAAMPGAMTPSEVVTAWRAGADFVKIFPAGVMGSSYIKALKGPLPQIPLLAVGGVTAENIPEFLRAGVVGFGIGSNLVSRELAESGQTEKITRLAQRFVHAVSDRERTE